MLSRFENDRNVASIKPFFQLLISSDVRVGVVWRLGHRTLKGADADIARFPASRTPPESFK